MTCLLRAEDGQAKLSAMLDYHEHRLIRFASLDVVERGVLEKFLLRTPIAMLVSDEPGLHKWWNPDFEDPVPSDDP